MLDAKEIIIKHGLIELVEAGKHVEVINVLKKYPEQRGAIVSEMLMQALKINGKNTVLNARTEMLGTVSDMTRVIGAFNEAFDALGVSPMINDTRTYSGVSDDVNETMVAEDMKAGLDLYNVCAEYCRIYNTAEKV